MSNSLGKDSSPKLITVDIKHNPISTEKYREGYPKSYHTKICIRPPESHPSILPNLERKGNLNDKLFTRRENENFHSFGFYFHINQT